MWYTLLLKFLGDFAWKLFIALLTDRVIKGLFFRIAHYLASKTSTAIDDQFVSDLEESFEKVPNSLTVGHKE